MLVRVADEESDRCTGRLPLEHAAQQLHPVCFPAVCRDTALPRPATVQLMLDEGGIDGDTGRHPVDDTAHGCAMALAEGGQCEEFSECVHKSGLCDRGVSPPGLPAERRGMRED